MNFDITGVFSHVYVYFEIVHWYSIGLDGYFFFIFLPSCLLCAFFLLPFDFNTNLEKWVNDYFNGPFELVNWLFYYLSGIWLWILIMSFKNTGVIYKTGIDTSEYYQMILPFLFLFLVLFYEFIVFFFWKYLTTFLNENPKYVFLANLKKILEDWDSSNSWSMVDEEEAGIVSDIKVFFCCFICFCWVCIACICFYFLTLGVFGAGYNIDWQSTIW